MNFNFKKAFIVIFLFFIVTMSLSTLSATNSIVSNQIDTNESQCCSVIIQVNSGESIIAFRQDGPLNGIGLNILGANWNDVKYLKQEINSKEYYCPHTMITKDGWLIGIGGSTLNNRIKNIENYVLNMTANNNISNESLEFIYNVLKEDQYGHCVIKAPDGRYAVIFGDYGYFTGTLKDGECLVVPNEYRYFKINNYTNYSNESVDAAINALALEDPSGINRRNIMTYDYKSNNYLIIGFPSVDVYATNDNGKLHNLSTENIVTDFIFRGKFFSKESIPENPNKLFVGQYNF